MDQTASNVHTSVWWSRRQRPPEPWQDPSAPPELPEEAEHVVVGAGLTGLATALLLARAGRRPLVIEARHVAAGTTGHSTAKVSVLQGHVYSGIASHHGETAVIAYAQAQREGQRWLLDYCTESGVPAQRRDAWTYATTSLGMDRLAREARACAIAGLPVEPATSTELPFDVLGALRLADQAQVDPVAVCLAMTAEVESHGGRIVQGVRMTGLSTGDGHHGAHATATVRTDRGDVRARRVVLATGTPVLDRGLHFALLQPQRSYAMAFRLADASALPRGMYLSVDLAVRSLRGAPGDAPPPGQQPESREAPQHEAHHDDLLIVGGQNHVVGRATSAADLVADLQAWTHEHFPSAELVTSWAAQDYRSTSLLPVVSELAHTRGRVLLATGFNKWGMANAAAAAQVLAASLLAEDGVAVPAWAKPLHRGTPSPRDVISALHLNASTGARLAGGWAGRVLPSPSQPPAEGEGRVEGRSVKPVAVCTVAGVTHRVSGVCSHLGGILTWNDSDLTWDCPLHGSRFTADGHRIEGPALGDLEAR